MSMTLVEQIAEHLGIDEAGARKALDTFAGQISHLVDKGGTLEIPGLGTFSELNGVIHFDPTAELADAVNHRFAGLETLRVTHANREVIVSTDTDWAGEAESSDAPPPEAELSGVEELDGAALLEPDEVEDSIHDATDPSTTHFGNEPDEPVDEFVDPAVEQEEDDLKWSGAFSASEDDAVDVELPGHEAGIENEPEALERMVEPLPTSSKDQDSSPSIARLFVPLVAVLGVIAVLLWFLNRSDAPAIATTTTPPQASETGQSTETLTTGSEPSEPVAGSTTVSPPPPPSEESVPLWTPGRIDRNSGGYTIVVSSEPSRAEAEAIARSIETRLSTTTDVFTSSVDGSTRYRVGVGSFASARDASQVLSTRSDELPEGSWVLRIQPSM